jgi:hypothetical protein
MEQETVQLVLQVIDKKPTDREYSTAQFQLSVLAPLAVPSPPRKSEFGQRVVP